MDRRRLATLITVGVVLVLLFVVVRGRQSEPPAAEDLVWKLIEASRNGDVDTYLNCFEKDLRRQLELTIAETSPEGFADYLRASSAPLTGVAVYDVSITGNRRATLTVEYVFRDATERQRMELVLANGGWRIADLERSRRAKPLIPYGAPAAEPPPEPTETPTM